MKKEKKVYNRYQVITGYVFMLPWIAGFIVFTAIPFVYTIYLSFHEVSQTIFGYELNFVGINNYVVALLRNNEFVPNLIEFLLMEVAYAPTIVILSFILAVLLNRPMKMRGFMRMLFFLPVIVVSGPVMSSIMDTGAAAVTGFENIFLFTVIANYSRPVAEFLAYMFTNFSMLLWFTGIPIILFINGLQKINGSVIEAAIIDAASPWQILWKITIPILRPIFMVAMIFTIVQLSLFSTNPVSDMIQNAIVNTVGGLGLASAFAWVYGVVVLVIIGAAFLFLKNPKETPAKMQKRLERKWYQQ